MTSSLLLLLVWQMVVSSGGLYLSILPAAPPSLLSTSALTTAPPPPPTPLALPLEDRILHHPETEAALSTLPAAPLSLLSTSALTTAPPPTPLALPIQDRILHHPETEAALTHHPPQETVVVPEASSTTSPTAITITADETHENETVRLRFNLGVPSVASALSDFLIGIRATPDIRLRELTHSGLWEDVLLDITQSAAFTVIANVLNFALERNGLPGFSSTGGIIGYLWALRDYAGDMQAWILEKNQNVILRR